MNRYSKIGGLNPLCAGALASLLAVAASPAIAEGIIYKVTYDLVDPAFFTPPVWNSGKDKHLSDYKSVKCGDDRLLVAFTGFREPKSNLDNFVTQLGATCRRYGPNQGSLPYGIADSPPNDDSKTLFTSDHRDGPLKTLVGDFVPTGVHLEVNTNEYVKDIRIIYRHAQSTGLEAEARTAAMADLPGNGSEKTKDLRCPDDFALTGADVKYSTDGKIRIFQIECRQLVHRPLTVSSTTYSTEDGPFEALSTKSGHVLISLAPSARGAKGGVQVFAPGLTSCRDVPRGCGDNASGLPGTVHSTTPVPTFPSATLQKSCVNTFPAPVHNLRLAPGGADVALGVADDSTKTFSAAIFSKLDDIIECRKNAARITVDQDADSGTLDVAFTPDGKFAFVSNEYHEGGSVGVISIERDNAGHITAGAHLLGKISTAGNTISGMALSPDGTRLYVTAQVTYGTPPGHTNTTLYDDDRCHQAVKTDKMPTGLLTVIDVVKATKRQDAEAIINTVGAGCSPTRIAVTRDGKTLWVTARGDNRVLSFDTAKLESNPDHALLRYANTGGDNPVGLALFHNGKFLAVANSNRFKDGTANATILSIADPASIDLVATIGTGEFPREITVGSDDATLYLTNYDSASFQVIHTTVR
jgi:DNA-binding beta-propeller fold protein YncE